MTRKTQKPAEPATAPAAEAEAAPASEASTEATAAEEEPTPTDPVVEPVVEPIAEVAADVAASDAAAAEPVAEAGADPIVEPEIAPPAEPATAPAAEAEDPIRVEALAIAGELDAQVETDPAFITHLLMEHPDGGTTDSYDVDEATGHYLVPVDDIALLQSHGFKVVGQPEG